MRSIKNDNLKAVIIILVMLGHVLSHSQIRGISYYTYYGIYIFHMPLMMIVSGYYSHSVERYNFKENFIKSFKRLIIPFIIMNIVYVLGSMYFESLAFRIDIFEHPTYGSWFLFSLFLYRITIKYFSKIPNYVLIALVFSIIAPLIPDRVFGEFGLYRHFGFYFYFTLGFYIQKNGIDLKRFKLELPSLLVTTLVVLVISIYIYGVFGGYADNIYKMDASNNYFNMTNLQFLPYKALSIATTLLMSLCIYNIIPDRDVGLGFISRYSMDYYIFHIFLLFSFASPIVIAITSLKSGVAILLIDIVIVGVFILIITPLILLKEEIKVMFKK